MTESAQWGRFSEIYIYIIVYNAMVQHGTRWVNIGQYGSIWIQMCQNLSKWVQLGNQTFFWSQAKPSQARKSHFLPSSNRARLAFQFVAKPNQPSSKFWIKPAQARAILVRSGSTLSTTTLPHSVLIFSVDLQTSQDPIIFKRVDKDKLNSWTNYVAEY